MSLEFVLQYITGCVQGRYPFSECVVVWQLGVIVGLIVAATAFLTSCIAFRKRPSREPPLGYEFATAKAQR